MEKELFHSSAVSMKKEVEISASVNARRDILELDPYVSKTAHLNTLILETSVKNQFLMEEAMDSYFLRSIYAKQNPQQGNVRDLSLYITQLASQDSTQSAAVFALQIASKNSVALDKASRSDTMEEDQASLQLVEKIRYSSKDYAIQNAKGDSLELVQYVGESALSI